MAESEEKEKTIADPNVLALYVKAGDIVNDVLKKLIAKVAPDASVIDICAEGDKLLTEETARFYKKNKEMKRGIAFPTCVSVNNCICHFSPIRSGPGYTIKDGDVVKIDLGAHFDGFIAVAAHTVVVGASKEKKVTGKKADVIMAAHLAAKAALKLLRPSGENYAVTEAIQKVAESFHCKPISGMLSHQLKQFRIDGEKSIIQNPNEAQRKELEKCEFEVNEVYAVDVLISTGEGKGREIDSKTTVFKKTDEVYQLKLKTSRAVFSEIDKKFGPMPFTLRAFDDENKARLGVKECVEHKLLDPFSVLYEKDEEIVAQFKFTVLLTANGPQKITGISFDTSVLETAYKVEDEAINALLALDISSKKKKEKKKSESKSEDTADSKTNQVQS